MLGNFEIGLSIVAIGKVALFVAVCLCRVFKRLDIIMTKCIVGFLVAEKSLQSNQFCGAERESRDCIVLRDFYWEAPDCVHKVCRWYETFSLPS